MPELPEVETVRRGLEPVLVGARIEHVEARRPDLRFPLPLDLGGRLAGRVVERLDRRAKYLLIRLNGGLVLAVHLGMSGSFRTDAPESVAIVGQAAFHHARTEDRLHDHVIFHVRRPDGTAVRVVFNDPRRFGYMSLHAAEAITTHPHFARLGLEPLSGALSGEALAPRLKGRAAPLKAALLDQTIIAGLGNIYVCEALWRSRLSPRRSAGSLVLKDGRPSERLSRLAHEIRLTLEDAVAAGGSTLRDHRQVDGTLGYFQHRFAVYDREDAPCPREGCRGIVARFVQSGRSTFHCPVCQR